MNSHRQRQVLSIAAALLLAASCTGSGADPGPVGGGGATGATAGASGSTGSGGTIGSGGASGSGATGGRQQRQVGRAIQRVRR